MCYKFEIKDGFFENSCGKCCIAECDKGLFNCDSHCVNRWDGNSINNSTYIPCSRCSHECENKLRKTIDNIDK